MSDGNWGVIAFLAVIAVFVVYIIAAAMRDRKKRQKEAEPAEEAAPSLPVEVPAAPLYCYSCMTKLSGEAVCPGCGRPTAVREKPGHLPVGMVMADRYTVGLALSETINGVTYLAADTDLERKLCLREFFPRDYASRGVDGSDVVVNPGAEERFAAGKKQFVREHHTLCALNGFSSAPGVTDLFYTNGTAYAVTAWSAGQPLPEYLSGQGRLSPALALGLFLPVIRQLAQEQSMGLLRCNLTPERFTVAEGVLKLEGLGVPGGYRATFLSPGYAPEELYRKSGVPGAWTDVYSLCAILYHCLTGTAPDAATDRVYRDNLRAPSMLGAYLSAGEEAALMKGLAVYGEDRFPDAQALYRGLYFPQAGDAAGEGFYRPIVDPLPEEPFAAEGGLFREPEDNDL